MQKSYFEARIKVLADFAKINLRNKFYLNSEDLSVNYNAVFKSLRKEEVENPSYNDEKLILTLQEILGNPYIQKDLDSRIKQLEKSTLTYRDDMASINRISEQLETILYNLPEDM